MLCADIRISLMSLMVSRNRVAGICQQQRMNSQNKPRPLRGVNLPVPLAREDIQERTGQALLLRNPARYELCRVDGERLSGPQEESHTPNQAVGVQNNTMNVESTDVDD
jgi:hypothetical protein